MEAIPLGFVRFSRSFDAPRRFSGFQRRSRDENLLFYETNESPPPLISAHRRLEHTFILKVTRVQQTTLLVFLMKTTEFAFQWWRAPTGDNDKRGWKVCIANLHLQDAVHRENVSFMHFECARGVAAFEIDFWWFLMVFHLFSFIYFSLISQQLHPSIWEKKSNPVVRAWNPTKLFLAPEKKPRPTAIFFNELQFFFFGCFGSALCALESFISAWAKADSIHGFFNTLEPCPQLIWKIQSNMKNHRRHHRANQTSPKGHFPLKLFRWTSFFNSLVRFVQIQFVTKS